ncbi:MAG: tetratricopeptide repeat protein [Gemmataceae bacterium]|nr:tetratricopeptide repeat protein [Gemmataceae bacterium]
MTAANSPWVVNVEEADFERAVIERSRERPVVVDFWSPSCGPCRILGPVLERLIAQRQGEIILAKVNLDHAPDLTVRYRIEAIPLVIAFRDGRPVLDFVGVLPETQLLAFLDRLMPTEADRLTREAVALSQSDPARAEQMLRQALGEDRTLDQARLALARLLLDQDKEQEAAELLAETGAEGETGAEAARLNGVLFLKRLARPFGPESAVRQRVEQTPKNAQARYELGVLLAAAGRFEEALEMLLCAAERDTKLASSKVREAMVQVFNVIGPRSALADDYRSRLATVLY